MKANKGNIGTVPFSVGGKTPDGKDVMTSVSPSL